MEAVSICFGMKDTYLFVKVEDALRKEIEHELDIKPNSEGYFELPAIEKGHNLSFRGCKLQAMLVYMCHQVLLETDFKQKEFMPLKQEEIQRVKHFIRQTVTTFGISAYATLKRYVHKDFGMAIEQPRYRMI